MKTNYYLPIAAIALVVLVLAGCIPTGGGVTPSACAGTQGCYLFSGNTVDSSGKGRNGMLYGATLTIDRKGQANKAYHFSGSASDRIELPNLIKFDTTGEISISLWSKTDNVPGYGTTVLSTTPDDAADRFQININWSGSPLNTDIFDYGDIGGGGRLVSPAQTVSFDTWEQYVFVKSVANNYMKIYKNGAEIANKTGVADIADKNKKVLIGGIAANAQHGDQFFKGDIDDVKIYNKALSASEVLSKYNSEK